MKNIYEKTEEWLLLFIIICLPLTTISQKYKLPIFGNNIPFMLLCLACFVFLLNYIKCKEFKIPHAKYIGIFCLWPILCTAIGAYQFPFWSIAADNYLKDTSVVRIIAHIWPDIVTSTTLLHVKYFCSNIVALLKSFLLPLIGFFLLITDLYQKNPQRGIAWISKAAFTAVLLMGIYSAFEICWLWTGNQTCTNILAFLNRQIYDIAGAHGWWPPLFWKGQLRSYTQEPSYFGIIASFLVPFLWYRVFNYRKKFDLILLFYFTFMIFMTKSRTATIVYFGEIGVFIFLSLVAQYNHWKKVCFTIGIITVLAFGSYICGDTIIPQLAAEAKIKANMNSGKDIRQIEGITGSNTEVLTSLAESTEDYVENNITSAAGTAPRSNAARIGNMIAMTRVGIQHPLFGVGQGYMSMYMVNQFPAEFTKNAEIQLWTNSLLSITFIKSGYPIINAFSAILAQFGILGLILFFIPLFYTGMYLVIRRENFKARLDIVCIIVRHPGKGQLFCIFH